MNKLNQGVKIIRQVSNGIFKFINNYNEDTLYLFDLKDVKIEYQKIKELYKSNPGYFDLLDFARNYSFAYYQKNNILDYQEDAEKMTNQIVDYIQSTEK
ncbi:hypothetical protein NBT05_00030 [Aquimarina sp. ERC-38]|uniref:hypothetical protein n=1 Tax=Aquimarina sp. ERC-38 TaxID=2949996 RepID=UPI0022484BED|nr:hypothetical protein [Aquimarina sp. ERC-38]UZO80890.1 hypothetical protein NBT05_00030 [Aquimarina sp. ERC-38]